MRVDPGAQLGAVDYSSRVEYDGSEYDVHEGPVLVGANGPRVSRHWAL